MSKKKCETPACTKAASYNYKGLPRRFCLSHVIPPGPEGPMVNVANPLCEEQDCLSRAKYSSTGLKPVRCAKHKLPGMVSNARKCAQEGCSTVPYFGPLDGRPTWCSVHRPDGCIDLVNTKCVAPGCNTRPTYGLPGQPPTACLKHRDGCLMVNTKTGAVSLCKEPGCKKQANFGPEGSKPNWCKEHCPDGATNLTGPRCQEPGCKTRASYGVTKATHCKKHCKDGDGDFNHSLCNGCGKTRAYYGFPTLPVTACSKCREPGMVYRPTKVCAEPFCTNYAIYGDKVPERCELHKLEEDKNLIESPCSKCNLVMPLINDLCEFCRPQKVKVKELKVKATLDKYNLDNDLTFYSYDQVLDSKCNLKRPDFVYDAGTHFVVVEVDERQHKSYSGNDCESIRMWSIRQALGLPVVFIRFNPDPFKTATGRPGRASDQKREETLTKWLTDLRKVEPKASCSVLFLFYDGWASNKAKVEELPHPVI